MFNISDVTNPLIIPVIFVFLSYGKKAYYNKEFSQNLAVNHK